MPSRGVSTSAALLVVGLLAGCAGQGSDPIELPAQNTSQWVMPLDSFWPVSSIAADYAENLLMKPCMEGLGYVWDVPWRDIGTQLGPTWNSVERRLFNVEIATVWGYHSALSPDSGLDDWIEFTGQPVSDAMAEAIDTCSAEVRETLPRLPGSAQLTPSLVQAAFDGAQNDSEVLDAARLWQECMQEVGLPDLPTSPIQMPTESLVQRFALGDPSSSPTGKEIDTAVADAQCREESEYSELLYQAEWSLQVDLLEENADELSAVRSVVEQNRLGVFEAINTNAPARRG